MSLKSLLSVAAAALSLLIAAGTLAASSLPAVSHDGLVLMKDTKLRAVYMKPGANLDEYDKVAPPPPPPPPKKNWQRNYNDTTASLSDRVTDQDMKNIRTELATEFNKVFTKVLTEDGHQMVTEGGAGVLIVQPAIVNLVVTSPDTNQVGMQENFSASAGQMTLYMQLHDGKTGDIIARIIDPKAAGNDFVQMRNSVTNRADAQRVLRRWATILSKHLGSVTSATTTKPAQ